MSTEDPQQAIDAKQQMLDAHDGKVDANIRGKESDKDEPMDAKKLTDVYIRKVNKVQGQIADIRKTIDIEKNTKNQSSNWQQLEGFCDEVENTLLQKLAEVDPTTMQALVETTDAEVSQLLEGFSTAPNASISESSDSKAVATEEIMRTLGIPEENIASLTANAIEHYGEEVIRRVVVNMRMTALVPSAIHSQLFGCPPVGNTDTATIGNLLGTSDRTRDLEHSPYAFLLTDVAPAIRSVREAARDKSFANASTIEVEQGKVINLMQQIADKTKGLSYGWRETFMNVLRATLVATPSSGFNYAIVEAALPDTIAIADRGIQKLVTDVKNLRPGIQALQEKQQLIDRMSTALDVALSVGSAESARFAGRTEESDRRYTQLLEQHGDGLEGINSDLARTANASAERLRDEGKLSPVEESLLFSDPRSPDALHKAIELKQAESSSIDILDQVKARQTFRMARGENFGPEPVFYNGHDVGPTLRSGDRTTLTYNDGRTLDVIVTAKVQEVIEGLPPGREPVLLNPKTNIQIVNTGRDHARTLLTAPSEIIVLDRDIGSVDTEGNLYGSDGSPIDLTAHPHREHIEDQMRNQKSFRIEPYQAKSTLATIDGKPYPYALYNLQTQSGVTVEGVTFAKDALALINAEPPKGKTLVLNRIPRAASLRVPDLTYDRRGRANYKQCVLDADNVTTTDLEYASIDGENLVRQNISHTKEGIVLTQKTETPIAVAKKEQEEKTRDIDRVLGRNPALHNVKVCASTIQQTVGHLQQFFEASQIGSAQESFVTFAREEAKPTLTMLKDPNLIAHVREAKNMLQALRGVNKIALSGLEEKLQAQINALDAFTSMLTDGKIQNLLETIMDASKFDADTWANFCTNDLPIIVATIAAACAGAALVVYSCGAATPLALAVAGSFGGAVGSIAGDQLGKELVYLAHQQFDSRVSSDNATFTKRSYIGEYVSGGEVFDEATGTYKERDFLRDVTDPLAKEFLQSFTVTAGTMGLGTYFGGALSKILQNSKVVEKLTSRSTIMKSVCRKLARLNQNTEVLQKAGGLEKSLQKALRSLPREIGEEFGDEAQEHFLEKFLNEIDVALAASDGVDGNIGLGTLASLFLAIGKNTRIGKKTIPYDVSGSDPQTVRARAEAIRAEATRQGATVTDLGHGYFTVRHEITVDGKTETETVQMMPVMTDADAEAVVQESGGSEAVDQAAASYAVIPVARDTASNASDIHQMTLNGEVGLIGARNRTGASPEAAQEAAVMLVNDRLALAKAVTNPETRTEAVARYNTLMKAQGGKELSEADVVKNCEKFAKVVAAIESGNIGLEGKYVGSAIRDLNKLMPGMDMEAKQALDRKLHEASMKNENEARSARGEKPFANMDQYMEWLLSPDQTIEGGRPVTPNGEFDTQDAVHLGTNPEVSTRLAPVVEAMSALANDPNATFTRAQVEQVLATNPQLDSVDRTILLETATILEEIEAKAGDESLPAAERWKILEFSARYVQDFRASPDFKATPQQLLNLVADNAVNLSHQNIMDHMTLVGSSHGTLHVLRGNSEMLNSLYGQMGFTPAMRVLAMQATFDHDMGYTKRTLVGKKPGDGVFDSSKDHPLESTLRVESKREAYEQIFGREGYVTIRNAVLDHSDAMGKSDNQFENGKNKLDIIADQNAPAADRVAAAVALVDCLATVSNLKASPLFKNNPEIVATMARIEQIHIEISAQIGEHKATLKAQGIPDADIPAALKTFANTSPEIAELRDQATFIRLSMQDRIEQMQDISADTRLAYLIALESTMQWEGSDFAITSNLGMLAASVSPDLQMDTEGKVHATYTVDINGLATISRALDADAAAKAATSGIIKAADDFGKFPTESEVELSKFVMYAGNMESADPVKRGEAEAYFAANGGAVSLPTNSRLVIELKLGKNPEYEATRVAVEAGLRIDAIRGLARANIDKLVKGEPITVEGVDGKQVELLDATALQTYAESTVAKYIASLPANYVMENARGEYVPIVKAFNEAKTAARTSPVTWQQFADRMFRTAGSSAPLQSQHKAA